MNPQTLKYLQQDELGKVIAKGLASVYNRQPQKPVQYLVDWLRNYSRTRQEMKKVIANREVCQSSLKAFQQHENLNKLKADQNSKQQQTKNSQIQQFKNLIKQHEYLRQMLDEQLPEFIEKYTDITGAYIGELHHPPKSVTEEDTDQQAHYNKEAQKVINYIGSSASHKDLMRGKMLALNLGVTNKAFTLDSEAPPAQQGQEAVKAPKQKYVYIPNVVKNQAVHYFKIPKLGAYLAVPLIYKSHLTEKIFDDALAAKNKYLGQLKQFEQKKKQQVERMKGQIQQLIKKITEMKQKNTDATQILPLETELSQLQKSLQEKQNQKIQQEDPQLTLQTLSYVVCVDNLGKDHQLNQKDIDFTVDVVEHFKNCWEAKQRQLLKKDVQTHVNFIEQLPQAPQTALEKIDKSLQEMDEQTTKQISQIENETLKAYKQEQWSFNKLKQIIKENQVYLNSFLKLKQFRILKYREILQNILYFLGYSKSDINVPGQAGLFWKQVKQKYINEQTFNKILNYVVQGPKQEQFKFYAKTPFLLQKFQACNQQEIFAYNVGLGVLVKFIKAALKHRKSNVELRTAQKQKLQQERDEILAENQKIAEQKAAALQNQKKQNAEQGFNQEQWSVKYDQLHPTKQVPAEVVKDVDNDMQ